MRKDLIQQKPIYSSFLNCDKDAQMILKSLFVSSKPYSDILKRLLIINNKDCLDTSNKDYQAVIDSYSLAKMIEEGYIRLDPKIKRGAHQQIKSYILVSFDGFSPNYKSPKYIDYNINFDIICYTDAWVLDDYKVRPLMVCGYIDGILNSLTDNNKAATNTHQSNIKLTGIGEYQFLNCSYTILNEQFAMYSLAYRGVHFTEDIQKIGTISDD